VVSFRDHIAFGAAPNPDTGAEASIQIIDLKTKRLQVVLGSRGFNTPRRSPKGRFLAAVHWGTLELAFYEFSTGTWRHIRGPRVGYLNWSADGARLYFLSIAQQGEPRGNMASHGRIQRREPRSLWRGGWKVEPIPRRRFIRCSAAVIRVRRLDRPRAIRYSTCVAKSWHERYPFMADGALMIDLPKPVPPQFSLRF
jgi:hypothetical protein